MSCLWDFITFYEIYSRVMYERIVMVVLLIFSHSFKKSIRKKINIIHIVEAQTYQNTGNNFFFHKMPETSSLFLIDKSYRASKNY